MSPLSAFASLQRARRRAGSALALVAAVSFVIETPMALAQTQPSDTLTNSPVPEKAKPKPKKTVSRHTATDNVSDDLNRRESQRAAQAMDVSEETLQAARGAFGKLGASTVGAAYAEVLLARREAGQRLAAYAQGVAEHIRSDVQSYRDADEQSARTLSS